MWLTWATDGNLANSASTFSIRSLRAFSSCRHTWQGNTDRWIVQKIWEVRKTEERLGSPQKWAQVQWKGQLTLGNRSCTPPPPPNSQLFRQASQPIPKYCLLLFDIVKNDLKPVARVALVSRDETVELGCRQSSLRGKNNFVLILSVIWSTPSLIINNTYIQIIGPYSWILSALTCGKPLGHQRFFPSALLGSFHWSLNLVSLCMQNRGSFTVWKAIHLLGARCSTGKQMNTQLLGSLFATLPLDTRNSIPGSSSSQYLREQFYHGGVLEEENYRGSAVGMYTWTCDKKHWGNKEGLKQKNLPV